MLTSSEIEVLRGLKDEPRAGSQLNLSLGTVYSVIKALQALSLTEEAGRSMPAGRGRPQVQFQITEKGRKVLALCEELHQLLNS
jgi:DNA-binding PadR family transcriptional regulator